MDKAIVLMSGGLNSAVSAAAVRERYEIYPLFVSYGHRALPRESAAFEALCDHFGVQHHWQAELSYFRQVGGNALIDDSQKIDDAAEMGERCATFVPGLIPALLTAAATFARRVAARAVVCGVSEAIDRPSPGRAVLYPDQRREFIYSFQYMLDAAMPDKHRIEIETPVADFGRGEIIKLGQRLKIPFEHTWSCYEGQQHPCGKCYGCASRSLGFVQARIPDPLLLISAEQ